MTSNLNIPKISKVNKMAGIKSLVGKKSTKTVKFMGEDVKLSKLSVQEVFIIQEKAKSVEGDEKAGFELLKEVVRLAVEDAKDLSDQDFDTFPMDELSKLAGEVMKWSGLEQPQNVGK